MDIMSKTITGSQDLLFLSGEMKIANLSMTGVKLRPWCLRVSHWNIFNDKDIRHSHKRET